MWRRNGRDHTLRLLPRNVWRLGKAGGVIVGVVGSWTSRMKSTMCKIWQKEVATTNLIYRRYCEVAINSNTHSRLRDRSAVAVQLTDFKRAQMC